jgi:magnesium chelatase family protein
MDPNTRSTLKDVAAALDLTARSVHRLMRVARTIADLRGQEPLGRDEILAAASLRDRSMETELAA